MKKILFLLIIGLLCCMVPACKKDAVKEYTCSMPVNYVYPTGIIFKGYDSTEISEFELLRYTDTNHLVNPLSKDTIRGLTLSFHNDTAFVLVDSSDYNTFYTLENHIDYKINLYKAGAIHAITGTRAGSSPATWVQDYPCYMYHGQAYDEPYQNIHLDNQLIAPMSGDNLGMTNHYYVVISKH